MGSGSRSNFKRIWVGLFVLAIAIAEISDIRIHRWYHSSPEAKLYRYYQSQVTEDPTAEPVSRGGHRRGQPLVVVRGLLAARLESDLGTPTRQETSPLGDAILIWADSSFELDATVNHGRVRALDLEDKGAQRHEHVGVSGDRYYTERTR
jgi:hypothetical protein